ncbi:hypothetical protein PR202_ga11463 [Eleusine coracana subsp. coracana]|uniref:FLZ-type domain-containing protein n=1 Tax=Eleusine coracana subsp. coracana TaxID=191504 RepID=A0AAV5C924_ELECO|nr:hypothetical protein PR202_ga11463 [Eleusine coracana subsp. coracana]
MLLRRRVVADDGAAVGRPRFFPVPRLLVRLAPPDCESPAAVRSPTSPLDLWAFPSLLRSPRSPRSWDSHRPGLGGIVDDDDALAGATNRLLGPLQVRPSPFKPLHHLATAKQSCASQPKDCARPPPELEKSGPEPIVAPGRAHRLGAASSLSAADLGRVPAPGSSLPAGRYVGSVSATEVEQSEDYTCIIAHGPNPKTTRIFGDCILEPVTVLVPHGESVEAMEVKEGAESYWLVKCSGEEVPDSCFTCKEELDGSDGCVYRSDDAFCTVNCSDQEILVEEEEQTDTVMSSFSSFGSSSSLSDDIFMAGMVVLTGPVDTQLP